MLNSILDQQSDRFLKDSTPSLYFSSEATGPYLEVIEVDGNSRLFAVDPYTAYQVAVALAAAYQQQLEKWDEQRWRNEINAALIRIEGKLDQLMAMVKDLFAYSYAVALESEIAVQQNSLAANRHMLSSILEKSKKIDPNTGLPILQNGLETAINDIRQAALTASGTFLNSNRYGYVAFSSAYCAAIVETTASRLLKKMEDTAKPRLDLYISYFKSALSDDLDSLKTRQAQLIARRNAALDHVHGWPKSGSIGKTQYSRLLLNADLHPADLHKWLLSRENPGGPNDGEPRKRYWMYFDIQGDPDSGFSAGPITAQEGDEPNPPLYPEIEGITYGSEFNQDQRRDMVMGVIQRRQAAYVDLRNKAAQATLHLEAATMMLESLKKISAKL